MLQIIDALYPRPVFVLKTSSEVVDWSFTQRFAGFQIHRLTRRLSGDLGLDECSAELLRFVTFRKSASTPLSNESIFVVW
jgi:hypothetical protein